MHRKPHLSWFDRLCWKLIERVAKKNPDAAVNMMGGGNNMEQLAKLAGRHWDPTPRGYSSRPPRG
jgi:hypothetical protein